jgi:hypothetical protein
LARCAYGDTDEADDLRDGDGPRLERRALEGEDAPFVPGGASPDAGNPLDDAIGHGDEDGIEMVKKRDGLKPFERS